MRLDNRYSTACDVRNKNCGRYSHKKFPRQEEPVLSQMRRHARLSNRYAVQAAQGIVAPTSVNLAVRSAYRMDWAGP